MQLNPTLCGQLVDVDVVVHFYPLYNLIFSFVLYSLS